MPFKIQKIHVENRLKEPFNDQVIIRFFNLIMCAHLRQLWNLNQPLEILQITGAIE